MEFHLQQLKKHCRVCGRRLSKAKGRATVYNCSDYRAKLISCFGVDTGSDQDNVHPPQFCNPCYAVTLRSEKASNASIPYTHSLDVFEWIEHSEVDCLVRLTGIWTSVYYSHTHTHVGLQPF